jgi:hypothetical protein
MRDYDLPARSVRSILAPIPYGAPFLVESSWFLSTYLQVIEGYRSDLQILYQPRVLFPEYFEPINLQTASGSLEGVLADRPSELQKTPHYDRFGSLIRKIVDSTPLYFEPNVTISPFLQSVARLDERGRWQIEKGMPASFSQQGYSRRVARLGAIVDIADTLTRNDSQQFLDTLLTNEADLLARSGRLEDGIALYAQLCTPIATENCSPLSIYNLITLQAQKDRTLAAETLQAALQRYPQQRILRGAEEILGTATR